MTQRTVAMAPTGVLCRSLPRKVRRTGLGKRSSLVRVSMMVGLLLESLGFHFEWEKLENILTFIII